VTAGRQRCYVGLAASLHDPAIAILGPDGTPLFAEARERPLQNKRAYHCPPDDLIRAPRLIQDLCGADAEIVLGVSWSDHLLRKLNMAPMLPVGPPRARDAPPDFAWPMPEPELFAVGLRNSLTQAGLNLKASNRLRNPVLVRRYDHHLSHAALAAYTSPFQHCAVAVIDGYGEDRSTSFFHYDGTQLRPLPGQPIDSIRERRQHVSLGHFYARLCAACGFDPLLGEEWKVMGLAAFGSVDPDLYGLLRPLVQARGLGLHAGCTDEELASRLREFRAMTRSPHEPACAAAHVAATGQQVFEDVTAELLTELHRRLPGDHLALAGGCALNSSCNGRLVERTPFRRLHVPSAPADDGCALGAAMLAFKDDHYGTHLPSAASSPYLGSSVSARAIESLRRFGGLQNIQRSIPALLDEVSSLLADGRIVGWVQGRAEFGPRALGHRSILADPRRQDMKNRVNAVVKFREEFRPFGPSILDEHGAEYFENYQTSRYMERTLRFRPEKRPLVPAVVHVDGTGRLQSVRSEWSPLFYDLIGRFFAKTGIPILLNTSLNVMGKPIVHSLEDALGVFFTTGLDALVVEDTILRKDRIAGA
jgi:carbamoyltransferase